ncbi:MAG: NAD(P)H-quinone oxidoreductase [Burkholderia sp.]|nr:NAD(P)H-quinone oxidoreductase [Burkholderia sp.]
MKVIEITRFGAPDVLRLNNRPCPKPMYGDVLIRVRASGINRPDVFQRKGMYMPPLGVSDLPGLEVAGEIVDGNLPIDMMLNPFGLKLKDHVCALISGGGYAEYAVAPLLQCLPVPVGLDDVQAASLPESFFTVWSNLFDIAQLGSGCKGNQEILLVQGGSSGIGVTAIQIAHALGFRVFTTAGSDYKCRACEQLGAERAINYNIESFVEIVKSMTYNLGVDVILDIVAGSYVPHELSVLADDGRLIIISLLGGTKAEVNLSEILFRRLTVRGSTLRSRSTEFKAKIASQLYKHVWPLIADGRVKPVIYRVFPAKHAADAHILMESRKHIGKIVLDWTMS